MKKLISLLSIIAIVTSFAAPAAAADYSGKTAVFVLELAQMTEEQIEELPLKAAYGMMKAAFPDVPARIVEDFEEEDLRVGLQMLAFSMKKQMLQEIMATEISTGDASVMASDPTTGGYYYLGDYSIAWVRESELSWNEIVSQSYVAEVDFFTKKTAGGILAAGQSREDFNEIVSAITGQVAGTVFRIKIETYYIENDIPYDLSDIEFTQDIIEDLVSKGVEWFLNYERNSLKTAVSQVGANQVIKATVQWAGGYLARSFMVIDRPHPYPNPAPGKTGIWYPDEIEVIYSLS